MLGPAPSTGDASIARQRLPQGVFKSFCLVVREVRA